MGSKLAERLKERSRQTVRQPKPRETLQAEAGKKGYRVVAVSLYTPEAHWIEETTKAIQKAGNPKANRSFLVREAILRLQDAFRGMKPEQIAQDIAETQRKRS
ncbi:MAG: hypothetical protein D4R93_03420 [Deltaproteobacteria bacterium]|nr:MAG: hypothetical protein D4R93_03420 [Deltaproteobacteria bacterium]